MRIVMIGPFGLRPKSTMSRRALPMAKALAARGHAVDVLLPPWDWPQDAGRTWEEDGIHIHNIALPPRLPFIGHLIITWRLARSALALRPDVVHCFKPKAYAGLVAMALWLLQQPGLTKIRLVVDADDREGWGAWNERGDYSWVQKRFFAFQERWGLTHCQAVTVASKALQRFVWSLGLPPHRVFYVPNGLPDDRLSSRGDVRRRYDLVGCPVLLLYTRFVEFAVERVVEIFRRVSAQVPEARLLVVGEGFGGEEECLLASNLDGRIVYAGWVEAGRLPDYLAAADVALYPCDDNLVNRAKCAVRLVELMAAGLPVVADDVGEIGRYVEHRVSGLLVKAGDVDTFAQSVVELLRDEGLRRQLGDRAQRRARRKFAWKRLVEEVEKAYKI
jgi:glycosyltransferase involved in cell wall biosynthesis